MIEALCDVLAARVRSLPFADRVVGVARPYRHDIGNGDELRPVTVPVPASFTVPECEADSRYLLPDAKLASLFFFEDNGTSATPDGWRGGLRLLGWVNPAHFATPPTDVQLVSALLLALQVGPQRRKTEGLYVDLMVSASVLPADAGLFGRYTDYPLVTHPYRVVGLELACTYRLNPACAEPMPERVTPPVC